MDCSENRFCASLSEGTRRELCKHCTRRFMKAKSIQLHDDYARNCMLIIDGMAVSKTDLGRGDLDHSTEVPAFFLGMPGRIINPHVTFAPERSYSAYRYLDVTYPTDTWVAALDHEGVLGLFEANHEFALAMQRSSVGLAEDLCRMVAFLRANYTYFGVMHFMQMLEEHSLYLSQGQIADLMNHDRSSVSKAMSRIKDENPSLWQAYMGNKGRKVEVESWRSI